MCFCRCDARVGLRQYGLAYRELRSSLRAARRSRRLYTGRANEVTHRLGCYPRPHGSQVMHLFFLTVGFSNSRALQSGSKMQPKRSASIPTQPCIAIPLLDRRLHVSVAVAAVSPYCLVL